MKFYGHGIVWNPVKNKALCKFINGELETTDSEVISNLLKLGYEHDGEVTEEKKSEEKNEKALTVAELKKIAKSKGIKGVDRMKRNELTKILEVKK